MIHTVKGFSIVNETEVGIFLELTAAMKLEDNYFLAGKL